MSALEENKKKALDVVVSTIIDLARDKRHFFVEIDLDDYYGRNLLLRHPGSLGDAGIILGVLLNLLPNDDVEARVVTPDNDTAESFYYVEVTENGGNLYHPIVDCHAYTDLSEVMYIARYLMQPSDDFFVWSADLNVSVINVT